MQRSELTLAVKTEARRLGFSLVGITNSEPPPHFPFYEQWIENGMQAGMDYLARPDARERRGDPGKVLPVCRSVIVLGIHYDATRQKEEAAVGLHGRVAAYAWGDDYHLVLEPRLQALADFLNEAAGQPVAHRAYTDTGPVLERDLAQRAGLGWIGKNTCLIHPRMGSSFLLAELLIDIELEADPPFLADHCGTCTRCIEACPTNCILPDRSIDAGRCISYLTIENKGPIPAELRPKMGNWVFGCDICQEVCPWNESFAPESGDAAFAARQDVPRPVLITEINLSPESFNLKFKNSPVQRPRRRGYLRNVAVALGNLGDLQALPALARALEADPEPLVRGHAAWAIGRIGGEHAAQELQKSLAAETDSAVRLEIKTAIKQVIQ